MKEEDGRNFKKKTGRLIEMGNTQNGRERGRGVERETREGSGRERGMDGERERKREKCWCI